MKQAFAWCCLAVCAATFARTSHSQFSPTIQTVITDTVPRGHDTTMNHLNNSTRRDSGYNNKYNSNRNMIVDTGTSNRNNMNPPTRDSLSNKPPQK